MLLSTMASFGAAAGSTGYRRPSRAGQVTDLALQTTTTAAERLRSASYFVALTGKTGVHGSAGDGSGATGPDGGAGTSRVPGGRLALIAEFKSCQPRSSSSRS